jgi:hypothetical protein
VLGNEKRIAIAVQMMMVQVKSDIRIELLAVICDARFFVYSGRMPVVPKRIYEFG